jgi:hypothetical protein
MTLIQRQNLRGRMLAHRHNIRRRVGHDMARENGRIHHMQILRPIHLGVGVDDGGAALERAVGSDLRGAEPVVGSAFGRGNGDLVRAELMKRV